jgi:hypothetical protein
MKQALITGGGSKFGHGLTEQLILAGYRVHLITSNRDVKFDSEHVNVIPVNWKFVAMTDLKDLIAGIPELDVVFFNHNASSLSAKKFQRNQLQVQRDWAQSYFVACQLPFYLVHTLANRIRPDTKIGWMLSELIHHPVDDHIGYADYIGNKFTNACIMRNFSKNFPAGFFGINPDGGLESDNKAETIIKFIDQADPVKINGHIYTTQGDKLVLTNLT